jgi:hypothetical protein
MLVAMNPMAESLLLNPVKEALGLARRAQEAQGFRTYLRQRTALLVPVGLLMLLTSVGCAAAMVLYLGGTRPLLVLLAILLVPFVLIGSQFVQAYVFVSWLESRALAKALHRSPAAAGPITARLHKLGIDMGSMPSVPWALALLFVFVPLAMLFAVVPKLAFTLIALHLVAPVAFARFDR